MPLRILAVLPLVILCACASSRSLPMKQDAPAAAQPLPPEIKPLTVEQEELANAMGEAS